MKALTFFTVILTSFLASANFDQVAYPQETQLVFRVNYQGPGQYDQNVVATVTSPQHIDWLIADLGVPVGVCFNGFAQEVFDIVVAMAKASNRLDITVRSGKIAVDYTSVGDPNVVEGMKVIVPSPYPFGAPAETEYLVRPCNRVTKPQYRH